MADYGISDIAAKINPPQQISLGDMVNMARGAQAYQQAAQINPLLLQEAEQKVKQSTAEATMHQQAASEQQAVKDFLSNPTNYQDESGNPDYSKLQKNVMALAPTTGAEIINKIATTHQAQTTAKQSFLNLGKSERDIYNTAIGPYAYAGDKNPQNYINAIKFAQRTNPDNKEFVQHGNDLIKLIDTNPGAFINSALEKVRGSQTPTEQESNLAQKTEALDVGGKIIQVTRTPQTSTKPATLKPTGTISGKSLTPQLAPTIQGGLTVVGGSGGENVGKTGAENVNGTGGKTTGTFTENIQPLVGQTKETVQQQALQGQNLFASAVDSMTNLNSKLGHLPTQKLVTSNIIKLLKDPTVDTGPIANYFSKNTGQESLTPKEQELAKYLEQRIQNLSPASQMDLQSKHTAYGSINLKKDALMDLMRNEAAQITAKDLFNRGVIVAGGNAQTPDLNKINDFKSKFALYANDPKLMKLISITGESKKAHLDEADKNELAKFLNGLSPEERGKLKLQREQVMNLIYGGK